jgi:hypothetical protein
MNSPISETTTRLSSLCAWPNKEHEEYNMLVPIPKQQLISFPIASWLILWHCFFTHIIHSQGHVYMKFDKTCKMQQ